MLSYCLDIKILYKPLINNLLPFCFRFKWTIQNILNIITTVSIEEITLATITDTINVEIVVLVAVVASNILIY